MIAPNAFVTYVSVEINNFFNEFACTCVAIHSYNAAPDWYSMKNTMVFLV